MEYYYYNNLEPTKMNWTRPKQLELDQNHLDSPNSFGIHRRTRHRGLLRQPTNKLLKDEVQTTGRTFNQMSIIQCSKVQSYRENQSRPFPQILKYRRPKSSHVSIFCQLHQGKTLQSFCLPFSVFSQLLRINFHPIKAVKILVIGI